MKKLHRLECPIRTEDAICCSIACICGTLQACEDRVAAAFHQIRKDDQKEWERFARDQFNAGHACALSAARDAVAALATERELRSPSNLEIDMHAALAAIDALQDETDE